MVRLIPVLFFLLQGCAEPSEVSGDTDLGRTDTDVVTDTDTDTVTDTGLPLGSESHAADIQPIWNRKCGGCHLDGSRSGSLNLDDGFASMVDIPSDDVPSMPLVTPGDPEASYLWHKLEDTHRDIGGKGIAMPKNDTLSAGQLDRIYAWIADGAAP